MAAWWARPGEAGKGAEGGVEKWGEESAERAKRRELEWAWVLCRVRSPRKRMVVVAAAAQGHIDTTTRAARAVFSGFCHLAKIVTLGFSSYTASGHSYVQP